MTCKFLAFHLVLLGTLAAGCGGGGELVATRGAPGQAGPGPLDGTWTVRDAACDGRPIPNFNPAASPTSMTIRGVNVTTVTTLSGNCQFRLPAIAGYPSSDRMTLSLQSPQCAPENCNAACGAQPTASQTLEVKRQNDALILTGRAGLGDICPAGQARSLVYTRS